MVLDDMVRTALETSLVYRKSGLGAAQLAHGRELSPRERHVLILLDGRRTIAELCELFGAETVHRVVPELEAKGFAKQVDLSVPPEWANAVTQLLPPSALREEPRRRLPVWLLDGAPMLWMALLTVFTLVGSYWVGNRYKSQADAAWQRQQTQAQAVPSPRSLLTPGLTDARGPEWLAPEVITPITRLPAVTASKPSGGSTAPARPAPQPVAREHPTVVRSAPRGTLPGRLAAAAPASAAVAVAGDDAPAAAADAPAATAPLTQVASATEASAPPAAPAALAAPATRGATDASALAAASPMAALIAAPAVLPAAEPSASALQAELAMQAPTAQPPTSPASLRPLRHDPPRFPEQARRDGIGESQVRVHLWITPEGKVDQVDIVQATPPRVFDEEVRRALSLWTFEPPGRPTEQVVDLTLKP